MDQPRGGAAGWEGELEEADNCIIKDSNKKPQSSSWNQRSGWE